MQTDVIIKEDGSASRMEVLEPSEIINFGVNDNPLKMVCLRVGDGKKGKKVVLTRSSTLLCFATSSRVNF
jgi:hypothetical protein